MALVNSAVPLEEQSQVFEIDFQDFFEVEEPSKAYNPPEDLHCKGRNLDTSPPHNFPEYYTFGSELVVVNYGPDDNPRKVISTRTEWYDFAFNLSRVDYKPYRPENTVDPLAGDDYLVSE